MKLKTALIVTSMFVAAPAFAQDVTTQQAPTTQESEAQDTTTDSPTTATPAPTQDSMSPATTAPDSTTATTPQDGTAATPPQNPTSPARPVDSASGTTQPGPAATSGSQVASVVAKEYGAYDKDASGGLDATEFGGWMTALRKASEPSWDATSSASTTWLGQAFTQADADKNGNVSQVELTTFLTPKAS